MGSLATIFKDMYQQCTGRSYPDFSQHNGRFSGYNSLTWYKIFHSSAMGKENK